VEEAKAIVAAQKDKKAGFKKKFANLQTAIKPVLEPEIAETVMASMSAFKNPEKWAEWGLGSTITFPFNSFACFTASSALAMRSR